VTTPRFIPPQQSRSQETLDRILDAAESVLEVKAFPEATLAEIMEKAGVTVGAFYRRFPDKDALLHLLDERFFAELYARADAVLAPERWEGASLRDIVRGFAAEAVDLYRTRRGLLRSLFLRARTDPVIAESARQVNAHLLRRLAELLGRHSADIRHPDPDRAIALGYMIMVGGLRETILFGEVWPAPSAVDGADMGAELARVYVGYLGAL
jgi:AcrR family transcriptional regulator